MIKNIQPEMDGFIYNIVQMSGEQAFKMQLKLMHLASSIKMEGLKKLDEIKVEDVLTLIKGVMCAANPDIILPLVKELLVNCTLREVNAQVAQGEGFNPERHFNKTVKLDNFFGKDLIHLYRLLYEILKANYEDFFVGAKKWLGSSFLGRNTANSPQS
jgi:hypothetical protein